MERVMSLQSRKMSLESGENTAKNKQRKKQFKQPIYQVDELVGSPIDSLYDRSLGGQSPGNGLAYRAKINNSIMTKSPSILPQISGENSLSRKSLNEDLNMVNEIEYRSKNLFRN